MVWLFDSPISVTIFLTKAKGGGCTQNQLIKKRALFLRCTAPKKESPKVEIPLEKLRNRGFIPLHCHNLYPARLHNHPSCQSLRLAGGISTLKISMIATESENRLLSGFPRFILLSVPVIESFNSHSVLGHYFFHLFFYLKSFFIKRSNCSP